MEIGRNDSCPCGSGKKYKKCCMKKTQFVEIGQVKLERFQVQKHSLVLDVIDFLHESIDFNEMNQLQAEFRQRISVPQQHPMYDGLFNYWLNFFRRFENGLRGIEWFVKDGKKSDAGKAELALKWTKLVPRLFQIVEPHEKGAIVEDLLTEERLVLIKSDTLPSIKPWAGSFIFLEEFDRAYLINGVTILAEPEKLLQTKKKIEELMAETQLSYTEVVFEFYPEIFSTLFGKEKEALKEKPETITTVTFEIKDKPQFLQYFYGNEEIHIEDWENEEGTAGLTGDWYRYEDNEAPGKLYIAQEHGNFKVEGSFFLFGGMENGMKRFNDWVSPIQSIVKEVDRKEEVIKSYQDIISERFVIHKEGEGGEDYAMAARERMLVQEPILHLNNRTLTELVSNGKYKEAEWWLRTREYHYFAVLVPKGSASADYNTVRRELGLPMSPFVSGGKERESRLEKVAYPFGRPQFINEDNLPIYKELGFTPETVHEYYADDIFTYYKKQVVGKSDATRSKYQKGLELLVSYLEWREAGNWEDFTDRDWAELVGYYYFEHSYDTSMNHVKSFLSVVKNFLKYIDQKYKMNHSATLSELLKESVAEIYASVSLFDLLVPYYLRKYGNPFYEAMGSTKQGIAGMFEITQINASSVKVKNIRDRSRKSYTVLLEPECMDDVVKGQLIEGSILKSNINAWRFATVERVFPSLARAFL